MQSSESTKPIFKDAKLQFIMTFLLTYAPLPGYRQSIAREAIQIVEMVPEPSRSAITALLVYFKHTFVREKDALLAHTEGLCDSKSQ